MTYKLRTIEEIIQEIGEIPLCQCKGHCGQRVKISPRRYPVYKKYGYPKFVSGHGTYGKKRPEHSELMKGSGNPMFGNPREDLQIKFKGEGNPMFGKESWNKDTEWSSEIKNKISESQLEHFELHPEAKEKLSKERKEYHKLHPECQIGNKNPMKNSEAKKKCSTSMKEFYKLHPEAIKVGKDHWSYGKPSSKLHMFSALDHLIKDMYCPKFNNKLREDVRTRDSFICQNCGIIQNGHKHSCHHIHYDKPNCYPDLITLCNICNIKANTNREYWESYYMNKLNNRELLFWTKRRNKEV